MAKLRDIILLLVDGGTLPARYRDHPLGGDWKHFRDCHIEPDWLLIYKIDGEVFTSSVPERTRLKRSAQIRSRTCCPALSYVHAKASHTVTSRLSTSSASTIN
jgi:addiction module RelE/StbE family toxin